MLTLAPRPAAAQERVITSIEPASIKQGETVLLTISGENLPVGTVALEFFPQQIALLDILSANASEVVAQVKVPSLVSPGLYNILLYNHLGDEVFAEGLLTITSDLITPIFRDYDPKVIAEATEGFALLLTGESITDSAVGHLAMRWYKDQQELTRLSTIFSKGGPGQVLCAVTGDLPGGILQGRIYLNTTPIYLVEISIESPTGLLVGHSPAQLPQATTPYEINLLGADLTSGFASMLVVELSTAETVAKAHDVILVDSASVRAVFSGPLPEGVYQLVVSRLSEQLYASEVSLTSGAVVPDVSPPVEVAPEDKAVPAGRTEPETGSVTPPVLPIAFTIESVAPTVIEPGSQSASLVINGTGLSAELAERLEMQLLMGAQECELLFLGAGQNSLTCLFAPPSSGWLADTSGTLTITDPDKPLDVHRTEIFVGPPASEGAASREPAVETLPEPEEIPQPAAEVIAPVGWAVDQVAVSQESGRSELIVTLSTQSSEWDPSALVGSFNLLPADPLLQRLFSNITLAGGLEFSRLNEYTAEGRCAGIFVRGDVLVEFSYGAGAPSAAMLEIDAGDPNGVVSRPAAAVIQRDPISGILTPTTLELTVDFSPLIIAEPGLMTVVLDPPPTNQADVVKLAASGSTLSIGIDLSAWQAERALGQDVAVSLIPVAKVALEGETEIALPVQGSESEAQGAIAFAQDQCWIDAEGFELILDISGTGVTTEQLAAVEAESSNLLLALNLHEFSVAAEGRSEIDNRIVRLNFTRDKSTLNDLSYELLREELLGSDGVELTLVWPELGLSAIGVFSFVLRESAAAEDILENLGLN